MKLNMKLSDRDIENIQLLKEKYGFLTNAAVVRFVLVNAVENKL